MEQEWGVKLEKKRPDGRLSKSELRPINCEFNVISNVQGSARFCFGYTSVVAAIHGPAEKNIRGKAHNLGAIKVMIKSDMGPSTHKESYYESVVLSIFEKVVDLSILARTVVNISIQVEENEGGVLSCIINSVMCALLIAGIPCTQTVFSVSLVSSYDQNAEFAGSVVDPTTEELCIDTSIDSSEYCAYTFGSKNRSVLQVIPEWTTGEQHWAQPQIKNNSINVMETAYSCTNFLKGLVRQVISAELKRIPHFFNLNNNIK